MAHAAFLIRGHKDWQEKFINELASRYVPFMKYDNNLKQLIPMIMQLRVCPIQLFDVCFPESQKDPVLNTIFSGTKGEPANKALKKYLWGLRKSINFKPIPDYEKNSKLAMSPVEHCEILGIGYKDDKWITEDGRYVDKKDKTPLSWEGI